LTAAGDLMKEVNNFVNGSVFYLFTSAVAALIWLGAGWLFGSVLSYSSLIVLVVVANLPWLITRVRSVEFPGVVKINFHKATELRGRECFKDNDKRNRQRLDG
jgi:hypothetical protein